MIKKILAVLAMCIGLATSALAGPISTNTWYLGEFSSLGGAVGGAGPAGGAANPGAPAWTFSIATTSVLSVFDCCTLGDAFEVFDWGVSLGFTSIGTSTCNSSAACAAGGAGLSRGDFILSGNDHSITMRVSSYVGSPGNLFFKVTTDVPEPATLLLAGLALSALGMSRRRTSRV